MPEDEDTKTFTFPDDDSEHGIGNEECTAGWCGGMSYPHPCEYDGCTGLVHANFGDERSNGDYWLYTRCDVCGESAR